jgi:hypothetical protein
LKELAYENMYRILVTFDTSQLLMSCENNLVDWNMWLISFTKLTSQFEMSALKAVQPLNKPCMSVTELTSQRDKSAANADRMLDEMEPKRLFILVTLLTSQSGMAPYSVPVHKPLEACAPAFEYKHVSTADLILEVVIAVFSKEDEGGGEDNGGQSALH